MADRRLVASRLVRVFPGGAGIHGIDLDLAAGEVHALVGLNGAGRTTLLRLLTGMLRPDSGTVRIDTRELRDVDPVGWMRVGHLIEHAFAYDELTARANLLVAARLRGVAAPDRADMVERAIRELGLERYAGTRARVLSQGNRQRLGLASALQHDPDLIILDEPTNALDPAGIIVLRDALLSALLVAGIGLLAGSLNLAANHENERVLAQLGEIAGKEGWDRLLGVVSQITAAGGLLGFGVILSWIVGREFADGTITGLFALPVSRPTIVAAKLAVYLLYALTVTAALVVLVITLGLASGLGPIATAGAWRRSVPLPFAKPPERDETHQRNDEADQEAPHPRRRAARRRIGRTHECGEECFAGRARLAETLCPSGGLCWLLECREAWSATQVVDPKSSDPPHSTLLLACPEPLTWRRPSSSSSRRSR